jgi:hypothetical protein
MSDVQDEIVAPVVQPEATPEPVAPPDSTAEQTSEEKPEAKPERTFTQDELDKILQKRLAKESKRIERQVAAEVENKFLRERLAPPQEAASSGRPELKDFQDYEQFTEALADWKAEQKFSQKFSQLEEQRNQQEAQRRQAEQAREATQNLMKGAEKYPDYEEVVFSDEYPVDKPTALAIARSKHAADIAYHLATHHDEARRIASLDQMEQVFAIRDLDIKFGSPQNKTTTAPEPVKPVGTGPALQKSLEKMTQKEFEAHLAKTVYGK